ncbi:beta-N-acetylhexosaminidase [Tenacibaculum jejuense]|uniref:beta-N-acetylhexosaminidase n=1 Tax=Tenacibaculum jejuense TaxID=584609 RepID=A0A238UAE9_9FLAO|nr:family 20 glycosylhydrolase [Tenacibaculum jejuense]SNR15548.1 Beta-hexosaminidase precursor [Tenacibaculum jejuense]
MKSYLFLGILCFCLFNCKQENSKKTPIPPNIIPIPLEQELKEGTFNLTKDTNVSGETRFHSVIRYLRSYLDDQLQLHSNTTTAQNEIKFVTDTNITDNEGYSLDINENSIIIGSKTSKGAFYAVQTLLQLIPVVNNGEEIPIQCIKIKDKPRFQYRGMHLDVARHYFSVAFIKKYIDLIASLKYNTFHWHLTEDQGWRIEIKKYPKLQEIAAYRDETLIGHYNDQPQKFDGKKYGGYYTQKEIKDIVAYASERFVTIIPEIEMPGHSQAAIAAYPELGCTDTPVKVATTWGVFDEVYCPTETTFKFLEDVVDEVVDLFPGKYIHIGGDEAPKTKWKTSEFCQQFIKEKNLKDEHGLQSYFITRMEKYINSKGKQIIGWDEILEGGLAPNATVMSWRGVEGAVKAAKKKHNVILTPTSHCYFDYYQSENENEPLAIGGYLPLEKVYHFNPIPEDLTKEEEKYVLGAQGNVWTEYMKTPEKVEYMVFPRAVALSEVLWSSENQKKYVNFTSRLRYFQQRFNHIGVNYANHIYEINGNLIDRNGKLTYRLSTANNEEILYTIDGSVPIYKQSSLYKNPIDIKKTTHLKALVFDKNGNKISPLFSTKINLHKAVGKKITLNTEPNPSYNAGGSKALINGVSGSNKRYGDKEWLGFFGKDVNVSIDLDTLTPINSIKIRFHNGNGQWIYAPKKIKFDFVGTEQVKKHDFISIQNRDSLLCNVHVKFNNIKASKVYIDIPNYGIIPEGKQGAGYKAWTFIDEIIIN